MKSSNFTISYNITTIPHGMIYAVETGEFRNTVQILFSFLSLIIIASALVQTFQWQSRHKTVSSPHGVDVSNVTLVIFKTIFFICYSFTNVMFAFIVSLSTYWLVFVNVQHTIFVIHKSAGTMTDNDVARDERQAFVIVFQILFLTHSLHMLSTIYKQCKIDIFFIDWEKSRGFSSDVSMWRSIMISKEWMKLQLTRRTKIEINMILLILLLNSFVDALPFKQDFPNNQNLSMIANIILSVWVWTFTTIGQLVSRRLILERCFIESQSQHYIDLSTIAKISTFIMDEDVRGYYVHCRSPYEYADCCYEELREYMEKESRGLYTQRGMDDPASPRDCQAFIFYATSIFRRQVNKALKSSKPNTARYELSSFLKSFIEQTPPPLHEGLRRKIRIATLGEKMMGFSTSGVRAGESGCVFYPDERTWISNYSFLKTTFQGLERDLFLQDVLTYCFILTIQSEVRTAVFFTYLMHLIRQFTCHHLGRRNVSKKAFVDKSFL